MSEMIGVQGDIDSIFNCIDFYQNLSVVGSVSIDDLRKSYIELYFEDYRERLNSKRINKKKEKGNLVGKSFEDTPFKKEIPNQVEEKIPKGTLPKVEVSNQDVSENTYSSEEITEKEDDFEFDDDDILFDWEKEFKDSTFEKDESIEYFSKGVILEDCISTEKVLDNGVTVKPVDEERVEYREKGIILEDVIGSDVILNQKVEYQEKGIILEDIIKASKDDNKEFSSKNVPEKNTSNYEYVKEGVILEEVKEKGIIQEPKSEDVSDYEDDDLWEDYDEDDIEESDYGYEEDYDEDDTEEQDYGYEEDHSDVNKSNYGSKPDEAISVKSKSQGMMSSSQFFEDSEDCEEVVSSSQFFEEPEDIIKPNNLKDKPKYTEPVNKPKEKKLEYKNVREYVKYNPGCTISEVKKYFSIKEIKKALMSSKIVEKKNKLYVV